MSGIVVIIGAIKLVTSKKQFLQRQQMHQKPNIEFQYLYDLLRKINDEKIILNTIMDLRYKSVTQPRGREDSTRYNQPSDYHQSVSILPSLYHHYHL
jgi:hypothetical protein